MSAARLRSSVPRPRAGDAGAARVVAAKAIRRAGGRGDHPLQPAGSAARLRLLARTQRSITRRVRTDRASKKEEASRTPGSRGGSSRPRAYQGPAELPRTQRQSSEGTESHESRPAVRPVGSRPFQPARRPTKKRRWLAGQEHLRRHGIAQSRLPNDHAFSGGAQAPSAATRGWTAPTRLGVLIAGLPGSPQGLRTRGPSAEAKEVRSRDSSSRSARRQAGGAASPCAPLPATQRQRPRSR